MAAPLPVFPHSLPPRSFAPTLPPSHPRRCEPLRSPPRTHFSLARPPASPIRNGHRSRRSCPSFPLLPPSALPQRSRSLSPRPASARPHTPALIARLHLSLPAVSSYLFSRSPSAASPPGS